LAAQDRARLEELFHRLVGQSPSERKGFLASLPGADADLAPELEALLEACDASGPLDRLSEEMAPASLAELGDRPAALTGTSVGQYEIGELIGRGGMGDVYRARDTRLGRDVALKFLPAWLGRAPAARDRFLVEARSVSSVDHDNVCTLHDLGETDDGRLFLIMPYYAGQSLKQRLAEGPLRAERAVEVALQVARGLAAAHERGVVHRDVKPGNLLLTEDGRVKILDFGVAKLVDVHMTRTGETPGTASYMSPEQRAGDEVDARSDLWSLGAVLYEMLTGKRPAGPTAVRSALASVPAALAEIVERLLAESPDARYPDARSLAEDLAVLAEGREALSARPAPSAKRFIAELKRRKVFRVAAVYGVMGFAVIEVAGNVFPAIPLPEWTVSLVVWLVLLGFPVAVVLAWAFETSPGGGVRRTRSVRPAILDAIAALPARRRWPIGLAALVGSAVLVGAAWFAINRDWGVRAVPGSGTEEAPITIAVMAASSSDTSGLAEGLVGLLAPGLGNVPGLRVAPENLVTDAWRRRNRSIADSAAALDVAREVGVHGAVVVTTISAGSRLRLNANVYWTEADGESGASVQVEGVRDSLIELGDELAVQLAGNLSSGEGQAAALASRSTRSLPAFRAFLLGERELRNSDLAASTPHLRRAVTEDSSFALAWYRLDLACGQSSGSGCEGGEIEHAIANADKLPARERLLVLAKGDLWGSLSRLPQVEDAVRRSPDDAELWNLLGELYMHNGWRAGLGLRAADSAFTRAVELLPRDSDALNHRIEIAQAFFHDPLMSERRIEERERILGRVEDRLRHRLKHDLVFDFGDPTLPARLADVPTGSFYGFPFPLAHPLSAPARLLVEEIETARGNPLPRFPQFAEEITRGRFAAALQAGDTEERPPEDDFNLATRACRAYMLSLAGVELNGTPADRWLDPATTDPVAQREELVCRGGHAVDEGRWAEAESWLSDLEDGAFAADSTDRPYWTAPAAALRNYLAWRRDGADPVVIGRSMRLYLGHGESWPVRWWIGQMLRADGRPEEALGVFESYWLPPWLPASLERAEISAELGRHGEARVLYETVLTLWADADAPLQPLVERARAGLAGVGPTEAMTPTDPEQ
jgi:hypothetical protein